MSKAVIGGWPFDTFTPITQGAFQQNCDNCGSETSTLTIATVDHATLTYAMAANHDPEGDSNGTSITVNRP